MKYQLISFSAQWHVMTVLFHFSGLLGKEKAFCRDFQWLKSLLLPREALPHGKRQAEGRREADKRYRQQKWKNNEASQVGMWKLHEKQMNPTGNWRRVLGFSGGQQHLCNCTSSTTKDWDYLGNGIRNSRSGYRCSKTGTKIRNKRRKRLDRRMGSTPAGKKGTGNGKGDNKIWKSCCLGVLAGKCSVPTSLPKSGPSNQTCSGHGTQPKPTPMVRRHRRKGILCLASTPSDRAST